MNNKSFYKNTILSSIIAGVSFFSTNAFASSAIFTPNYGINFDVDRNGKLVLDGKRFDDYNSFRKYIFEQTAFRGHGVGELRARIDPSSLMRLLQNDRELLQAIVNHSNKSLGTSVTLDELSRVIRAAKSNFDRGNSKQQALDSALRDASPQLKQVVDGLIKNFSQQSIDLVGFLQNNNSSISNASSAALEAPNPSIDNLFAGRGGSNNILVAGGVNNSRKSDKILKALANHAELRGALVSVLQREGVDYRRIHQELWKKFIDSEALQEYFQAINDDGIINSAMLEKIQEDSEFIQDELSKIIGSVRPVYHKKTTEIIKELVELVEGSDVDKSVRASRLEEIKYLIGDYDKVKDIKAINSVGRPDNYTTHGMMESSQASSNIIDGRMSEINSISGLAAGDHDIKFGAWFKGSFSKGEQKSYSMDPGYKFDQAAFTIGADSDFGSDEAFVIGGAVSVINNNLTSLQGGDSKEKISSYLGSLYGMTNIGLVCLSGHAQFGKSDINKDRDSGDGNNNVAKGQAQGDIYGAKLEAGYNYPISSLNIVITPKIGVSHNYVSVGSYTETGVGLNRKVDKRSSSRTDLLTGLGVNYSFDIGGIKVIPEINASFVKAMRSKNSDTKIYLIDDMEPIIVPARKLNKNSYRLGAALNLLSGDSFDTRFAYDMGIAEKFNSHTGSVKLRVNF